VPPDAVVEDFDVIEDRGAGLGPGGEGSSVYELVLEGAPEGFHDGVVVAVGLAAHGRSYVVVVQHGTIGGAGVLDASIGVME